MAWVIWSKYGLDKSMFSANFAVLPALKGSLLAMYYNAHN